MEMKEGGQFQLYWLNKSIFCILRNYQFLTFTVNMTLTSTFKKNAHFFLIFVGFFLIFFFLELATFALNTELSVCVCVCVFKVQMSGAADWRLSIRAFQVLGLGALQS